MEVFSGWWPHGHVQGIAVDQEKGFAYFSFTTILVKTDMNGKPVGSVKRLAGHLGCIDFDPLRRRVYGSLELKHDVIGKNIINRTGWDPNGEDNFYLVSFDADAIDRMDMDAELDGVMKAVWLRDPVVDYAGTDPVSGKKHIYGCSGIDATAIGPVFGGGAEKLMIAYGVYSETDRQDNDHQVILQYDPSVIDEYGQTLNQETPHHSGPDKAEQRYFLYTGNTRYGMQNLTYEPASGLWLAAVYKGQKPQFGNFPMFLIDGRCAPVQKPLTGRDEEGVVLQLAPIGQQDEMGVWGLDFPYGSTGMEAVGDGTVWISHSMKDEEQKAFGCNMVLYQFEKGILKKCLDILKKY